MGLNGVEVIVNSSASHAELRKLSTRLALIQNCTRKLGGVYIYANATGVGGFFDCTFIHSKASCYQLTLI